MKVEGQGQGMEWTSILASAQAMVQRHQGQLADELQTDPSAAGPSDDQQQQQQQQQEQQQQGSLQYEQHQAADGRLVGQSESAGPSSSEQQTSMQAGDQGVVTIKQEAGVSQKPEEVWLSDMVSGCVSMLLTMQRCAQQPISGQSVNAALVSSLRMLQPHAASNQPIFRKIEQTVMLLRNQLLQGSPV